MGDGTPVNRGSIGVAAIPAETEAAGRRVTLSDLQRIYAAPFFDLIERARATFSSHWNKRELQLCTLLSIKTGGVVRIALTVPKAPATKPVSARSG